MRIPARLMPHRIIVESYQGAGTYGETWASPFEVRRAYVEDKQQQVTNLLGEQELSTGFVIIDPEWQIPGKSRITVRPGEPTERTAKVIAIARYQHPAAASHQVLYLGGA